MSHAEIFAKIANKIYLNTFILQLAILIITNDKITNDKAGTNYNIKVQEIPQSQCMTFHNLSA